MKMKIKVNKIIYQKGESVIVRADIVEFAQDEGIINDVLYDHKHNHSFIMNGSGVIMKDDIFIINDYYWKKDAKFGDSIVTNTFDKPYSDFASCFSLVIQDKVEGVGKAKIKKIIDAFDEKVFEVLEKTPEKLYELKNETSGKKIFTEKQAKAIIDLYLREVYMKRLVIDLLRFNLSREDGLKILKKFGGNSIHILNKEPFKLIDILNIKECDTIASGNCINPLDKERLEAFLVKYLQHNAETFGHLYVEKSDIYRNLEQFINDYGVIKTKLTIKDIETILKENDKITIEDDRVYIKYFNFIENKIVENIKNMLSDFKNSLVLKSSVENYIDKNFGTLEEKQKEAVIMSLTNNISILTGGPGTGKTHTINAIIKTLQTLNSSATIKCVAPTGKASDRIKSMTGLEASTIHRSLGILKLFEEQELKKIEDDFVICDESSMIDADLFYKLISNLGENTKLLIVGDHNQLPSVGAGLILRDLIKSEKIPTVKLEKIFRQAEQSTIILNAHKVINEQSDLISDKDFEIIETTNPEKKIIEIYRNNKDVQILTPMNVGMFGTQLINKQIQKEFNEENIALKPEYRISSERTLRYGDKVIMTKNNSDLNVFNGQVGVVIDASENANCVVVDFDGEEIKFQDENIKDLQLAYALTIHKSQGSEYDNVVILINNTMEFMNNKNLLYTAITRSKSKVWLIIDKKETIEICVKKNDNTKRNSHISTKISNIFIE
jgi:exodeoxyribonuclease V alpha subunit